MHRLIGLSVALAAAALAGLTMLVPAAADVSVGAASACVQPSANPHPTDPAGSTTGALLCATPTPSPSSNGSGTGNGSTGSGGSGSGTSAAGGSRGSGTTAAGTGGGGAGTTPASSTGPGTSSGSSGSGVSKSTGDSAHSSDGSLFGGLVGFFSATGGLVFLFALLVLMAIILVAVAAIAWLPHGRQDSWASRVSRLTFRPKN